MRNFFKIKVLKIQQLKSGSGAVYSGRITFGELLKIHRLTERKESLLDPFGEKNESFEDDKEFQRHLSETKLLSLHNFLGREFDEEEKSSIIFPSSVILSLDINENNADDLTEEQIQNYYTPDLDSCFVVYREEVDCIYVPKNKGICLIVDGQHRFYGLKLFYESTKDTNLLKQIESFQFISTILLGYDTFQVAEVFANVNFNQKPVNRSLYYDIFGSAANEKNDIQLAHFLALHMQNNESSPLKDMIKLLGKGYGLFSQAFFVEKLLIHFKDKGVWNKLYKDYLNDGKDYLKIPIFLKAYFGAIEQCYPSSWPQKVLRDDNMVYSPRAYDYILCKTTGMGAYLRLIKDIYPLVAKIKDQEEIKQQCISFFSEFSDKKAKILFSKSGKYGKGGSEGFQIRLYKELRYDIYKLE